MKTRLTLLLAGLLFLCSSVTVRADETITVTATESDISANLDLNAVATVFGESKDLEEFEQKINDEKTHISNLDLNGDGIIDYLRVVESTVENVHVVLLQAVLAKDIYQDVASIYVEKDEANNVTVQVVGDEYVYGVNYVVEPVYLYTPVIYDYFWAPYHVCYVSPFYWGYYPTWWRCVDCWIVHDYWHHIYTFHHHHPYCSFRHPHAPDPHFQALPRTTARHDYAVRHPEKSFQARNSGRNVTNARALQPSRSDVARSAGANRTAAANSTSRTFGSSNVRPSADRVAGSGRSTASRSQATGSRSATDAASSSSRSATGRTATASRTSRDGATADRSNSASATRSTTTSRASSATSNRSSSVSSVSRASSSSSRSTTATASRSTSGSSRSGSATATRSTTSRSTSSSNRSSASPARSTSSYSSGSRTSSGAATRSSSSSYGGSSRSSSSSYGGASRSGGSSYGGASRSGGSMGGASRSGGGGGSSRSGGGSSRR